MTGSRQKILFHFPIGRTFLPDRQKLKRFLMQLFRREGVRVHRIHYIFCSDADLLKINKKYLNHHTLTDIITFPFHTIGEPVLSEVYISMDRIRENARYYQTTQINELYRVIFHGALHLCGYNDKKKLDKLQMKQMEDFYIQQYGST